MKKYRPPCDCIVFSERNEVDKFIYKNEEVIKRTLDALRTIQSQSSGVTAESELQFYIDQVYPKWSEKEKEDFDRVYIHLSHYVRENLAPFIYYPHREEEFEKQFDGIKVLPSILKKKYLDLLEANQFIKAESLKVSISKKRFMSMILNENIQRDIAAFLLIHKEEIKEQTYFVVNRKYNAELGLQWDLEENFEYSFNFL